MVINPIFDLFGKLIGNLGMIEVCPPNEDISIVEKLVGKTLLRVVEGGEGDLIAGLGEELTDASVNAVGIYGLDGLLGLFVAELVPNRDADLSFHSEFPF
jgi:hypothetical protein